MTTILEWQRAYFRDKADPSLRVTWPTMATLMTYADKDLVCFPSYGRIAKAAGYATTNAVRVHIKANIEAGWLKRLRCGGPGRGSSKYRLVTPNTSQEVQGCTSLEVQDNPLCTSVEVQDGPLCTPQEVHVCTSGEVQDSPVCTSVEVQYRGLYASGEVQMCTSTEATNCPIEGDHSEQPSDGGYSEEDIWGPPPPGGDGGPIDPFLEPSTDDDGSKDILGTSSPSSFHSEGKQNSGTVSPSSFHSEGIQGVVDSSSIWG